MLQLSELTNCPGVPPSGQLAITFPKPLAQTHPSADYLKQATSAASLGALHLQGLAPLLTLSIGEKPGWRARLPVSMCLGHLLCVSPVPKGQMPGPTSLMMTFRADFSGAAVGAGAVVAGAEVNGAVVGGAVEGTAVDGAGV